jgi:hypothetical protein
MYQNFSFVSNCSHICTVTRRGPSLYVNIKYDCYNNDIKRATIGWACSSDSEDKKYIQKFCEEVSWRAETVRK